MPRKSKHTFCVKWSSPPTPPKKSYLLWDLVWKCDRAAHATDDITVLCWRHANCMPDNQGKQTHTHTHSYNLILALLNWSIPSDLIKLSTVLAGTEKLLNDLSVIMICAAKVYVYRRPSANEYSSSWIKTDQHDVTCFINSLFTAQHVSNVSTSRLIVDLFHVLYCSGSMCVGVTVWFGWGGVVSLCRLQPA